MSSKTKKTISKKLKKLVWDTAIGTEIGQYECLCCNTTKISQLEFHAGHIQPESKSGETTVDNLVPICPGCNSSMNNKHMAEFMRANGFTPGDKLITHTNKSITPGDVNVFSLLVQESQINNQIKQLSSELNTLRGQQDSIKLAIDKSMNACKESLPENTSKSDDPRELTESSSSSDEETDKIPETPGFNLLPKLKLKQLKTLCECHPKDTTKPLSLDNHIDPGGGKKETLINRLIENNITDVKVALFIDSYKEYNYLITCTGNTPGDNIHIFGEKNIKKTSQQKIKSSKAKADLAELKCDICKKKTMNIIKLNPFFKE